MRPFARLRVHDCKRSCSDPESSFGSSNLAGGRFVEREGSPARPAYSRKA